MRQTSRILLLGSAGYLGRMLMTHLQSTAYVVPAHRSKAHFAGSLHYDFWTDNIHSLVEHHQINTVIIAANMAYEAAYPFTFFKQRADQLIRGCQQCRVIYLSSDGVFDGKKGHYAESDVPTPMTLYGRNLQYLEEKVQYLCSDYCIIRPSYLYGYSLSQLDPRLSRVQEQLLAGEHLTYFTDMIKSPLEVNQVAQAIALLACSTYVGIVHVAGEAMSVYDFYREAMSSLGIASEHLYPGQMPTEFLHPRDTSLDITLMKNLTEIEPLPVRVALTQRMSELPPLTIWNN
jgi:dTDP-4-dehydrorhamnose reductase